MANKKQQRKALGLTKAQLKRLNRHKKLATKGE
jgi:hypothetical protein